jgi:hypothetical protein
LPGQRAFAAVSSGIARSVGRGISAATQEGDMRYLALGVLACLGAAGANAQEATTPASPPRQTATVADSIMSQILAKRCWTDQDDMADARRLRATLAIQFGRDGHFLSPPKLVSPAVEPTNDPPLQLFIVRARKALDKCNVMGFTVPEAYFSYTPPLIIELEFRP